MTSSESKFLTVQVPEDRVLEVYALLAQPQTPTKPAGDVSGWTEALLRRLYMESADNAQAFLRYLAKADGAEVSDVIHAWTTLRDAKKGYRRNPIPPMMERQMKAEARFIQAFNSEPMLFGKDQR